MCPMLVGLFAVWPLPKAKDFGDVPVAAGTSQALVIGQLDRTESLTCDISLVNQRQGVDCPNSWISGGTKKCAVVFLDRQFRESIE